METTLIELKEILLNLKEEIKEIKQEIGKIKIEMTVIQMNQKKNKKLERFEIIKSRIIGTSFKKPTQKPQAGSYDAWFMDTQYPKILRASPKNSSNKILLLIWRATSTFKAPKDTPIKILEIRNDHLSSNLKSYFLPLQFIFYYFLLKKKRNVF